MFRTTPQANGHHITLLFCFSVYSMRRLFGTLADHLPIVSGTGTTQAHSTSTLSPVTEVASPHSSTPWYSLVSPFTSGLSSSFSRLERCGTLAKIFRPHRADSSYDLCYSTYWALWQSESSVSRTARASHLVLAMLMPPLGSLVFTTPESRFYPPSSMPVSSLALGPPVIPTYICQAARCTH